MQRWGKHPSGSQRWRCPHCKKNTVWKRKDNRERSRLSLFVTWILSKKSLVELAFESKVSIQTLIAWFRPFWFHSPKPKYDYPVRVLVLDATSVVTRQCMLLIAGDNDRLAPVSWFPTVRECLRSWYLFLSILDVQPTIVVCDGQRGLLKAIHEVWPHAHVQRCLVHIIRQASAWLTQNPKTRAGRQLLLLVKQLRGIRTRRQKRRWIRAYRKWDKKYEKFLKEKSFSWQGRWWYTHRRLRGTRSLIENALPDLFRFVTDPTVPRTSNHVEGGINARLKELFRSHRGFSQTKKLALASWYLALRQGQKPTRFFN
jgi:hypothetical protein